MYEILPDVDITETKVMTIRAHGTHSRDKKVTEFCKGKKVKRIKYLVPRESTGFLMNYDAMIWYQE